MRKRLAYIAEARALLAGDGQLELDELELEAIDGEPLPYRLPALARILGTAVTQAQQQLFARHHDMAVEAIERAVQAGATAA